MGYRSDSIAVSRDMGPLRGLLGKRKEGEHRKGGGFRNFLREGHKEHMKIQVKC